MATCEPLNFGGTDIARSLPVKRWSLGIATVVTAVGALTPSAPAAVVAHAINVTLNATALSSYALDVNQDGTPDFTISASYAPDPVFPLGFDTLDFPSGTSNAAVIDSENGGAPSLSLLTAGTSISSSSLFSQINDQGNFYTSNPFLGTSGHYGGQTGYVGLRFTGGTYYGYAQVGVQDINAANAFDLTIGTVAYKHLTAGTAITAAAVPEPASIGLLAAGAVAMFGRRRFLSI